MQPRMALNLAGDRLAALPLAILYVTDRCNSRCITCDYWQFGQTNLPVAVARRLAPELRSLGTQVVLLSGGEPLLHPHWDEIAETLHQAGLRLWLLTAGLSLARHAARVNELCERVTVSLDGATPETYQAIRGVDGFEAVCKGIQAVVAAGRPVTLRCTVQRGNYRELPRLVRLARELGVAQVSFLAVDVSTHVAFARAEAYERTMALGPADLTAFGEVLDELEREFPDEFASRFIAERPAKLRRLHQYFAALLGQGAFPPVRCNAPRFSSVIGADGHLQPCYFIDGGTQLDSQPLSDALNAPALVGLRGDIRAGRRAECAKCVCSMYKSPKELVTGNW
jgi:Fe-coproporphyrin III synthase